ncbi:MAG: gliding motility-associated C-terminal domain-containing protein, partial [Crocinitomicaceae bacterium]
TDDAGNTVKVTLIASGNGACSSDTVQGHFYVNVNPLPTASITDLTGDVCPNDSIQIIGASATNGSVLWTTSGTGTFDDATIVNPTYTPSLTDAGSNVVLTMTVSSTVACVPPITPSVNYIVSVKPLPTQKLEAGIDDTLSLGSSISLSASGSGIVSWDWSPSTSLDNPYIMSPNATPDSTTTYYVVGTDVNGCRDSDSVTVYVEADFSLVVSNMMTPNGDGKNDTWMVGTIDKYPNTSVIIVNRKGQVLYENNNYDNTWDGTYNGQQLPDGTYYYIITSSSSSKVYKGSITIFSGNSK